MIYNDRQHISHSLGICYVNTRGELCDYNDYRITLLPAGEFKGGGDLKCLRIDKLEIRKYIYYDS